MFTFIKKLFGFDQETMKAAGVQTEQAPYKVEQPIPAYDIVPQSIIVEGAGIVETSPLIVPEVPVVLPAVYEPQDHLLATDELKAFPTAVNDQITDSVTQAVAKPARKPRAPKTVAPAEKPAAKKAAPVKKAAAIKATRKVK